VPAHLATSGDPKTEEKGDLSLSSDAEGHNGNVLGPQLDRARQTANVAHGVVIRFKEMGLPESLDAELASLCTDLGDLWSAGEALSESLQAMVEAPADWEALGDSLVDIRTGIDHMSWHLKSVKRPLTRITHHAYRQASTSNES
jgi:hypothetical protein